MIALALIVAFTGSSAQTAETSALAAETERPTVIDLLVLEAGRPVAGIEMIAAEKSYGQTDDTGTLSAEIPSGRLQFLLKQGEGTIVDLDLLTDAGEIVQVIVTLKDGEPPRLDIENSGRTSVLAEERLAETSTKTEEKPEEKQPPGALVGTIISAEDEKPVQNAQIYFSGVTVDVRTDKDGKFAVELPAGLYSISIVHPNFAQQTKDNVRVIPAREVTLALELTPAGLQLSDYVVTAPYVEGSIASTIEQQRETSAVSEVLGAEQMSATGDSDAAEALQRVSGLTIDQGKFVLVRGQPYRYTYTLWNGSPLPSPEPLIRVVPLDLFPTGVLAGIEVQKSYSADKPGEFGAGLINLQTRGIPDEGFLSVALSSAYNSESAFTDGLTYQGGGLDFLGFDDGTRSLPDEVAAASEETLSEGRSLDNLPEDEQNALAAQFENNYNVQGTNQIPDFGVTLAGGNSVKIFNGGQFGAVGSIKWGTSWREQDRIQRSFALSGEDLVVRNDLEENRTDFNSNIGALLTVKAKWDNHVFASNTFYAHQTQQRAQVTTGLVRRSDNGNVRQTILNWIERALIAQQLTGSNDFGFIKLDYRGMLSIADRQSPDRREYGYVDPEPIDGNFIVFGNSGINREYNKVDDSLLSFGLDVTIPILDAEKGFFGLEGKVGFAGSFQDRDSVTQIFRWRPDDENGADLTETNPEVLYDPVNSGTTLIFGDFSGSTRDDSTGFLNVLGGYGMFDLRLGELFRVVAGVRYETASLEVTTYNFAPDDENAETGSFDQNVALPALSGTWFVNDDMQVRAAYSQTTSRPNLNELSTARFFDPDSGEGFVGDPELGPAKIEGIDLRWEWYPTATESLMVGGFWKGYTDPIERTFTQVGGTDPLGTFQNADLARVFGFEMGGRFEFGRIREWLDWPEFIDNIYVMGNIAILTSEVRLSRAGVDTNPERALDGQANYAVNAQAGYGGEFHDITLAFNQVGTRLHRAGIMGQPDIFLQPIPTLDITWTWRIWNDVTQGQLRLNGSNLLNPTLQWKQGEEVWREFQKGISLNLGFRLTF